MSLLPKIEEITVKYDLIAINKANSSDTILLKAGQIVRVIETVKYYSILNDKGKYVILKDALSI